MLIWLWVINSSYEGRPCPIRVLGQLCLLTVLAAGAGPHIRLSDEVRGSLITGGRAAGAGNSRSAPSPPATTHGSCNWMGAPSHQIWFKPTSTHLDNISVFFSNSESISWWREDFIEFSSIKLWFMWSPFPASWTISDYFRPKQLNVTFSLTMRREFYIPISGYSFSKVQIGNISMKWLIK